jgi:hypothetical protein
VKRAMAAVRGWQQVFDPVLLFRACIHLSSSVVQNCFALPSDRDVLLQVKTWEKTPTWLQVLLVIGAITCYLATMLFAGASDLAFEDINLSTDYR